jgi:DNA-binding HxlR family transcriptional regulator
MEGTMKDQLVGHCPASCTKVRSVLARVGDSWSVLVILALDGMGVMRFNELKRHLGISQRMLSLTLRELERDGMVRRTVFDSVPPRVEYELTLLGASFGAPIRNMGRWALDHLDEIDTARAVFDTRSEA